MIIWLQNFRMSSLPLFWQHILLSYHVLSPHMWWTFFIWSFSSITLSLVVKIAFWTMSQTCRCSCIWDFIHNELRLKVLTFLLHSLEFLNPRWLHSHEVPPKKMMDLVRRLEEGLVKSASSKVCHSSIFVYDMQWSF